MGIGQRIKRRINRGVGNVAPHVGRAVRAAGAHGLAGHLESRGQLLQIRNGGRATTVSASDFAHTMSDYIESEQYSKAATYLGTQIAVLGNNALHDIGDAFKAAPSALMEIAEHPWKSAKEFGTAVKKKLDTIYETLTSQEMKESIKEMGLAIIAMCKGACRTGKQQMEKAFKGLAKACGVQQTHGMSR